MFLYTHIYTLTFLQRVCRHGHAKLTFDWMISTCQSWTRILSNGFLRVFVYLHKCTSVGCLNLPVYALSLICPCPGDNAAIVQELRESTDVESGGRGWRGAVKEG